MKGFVSILFLVLIGVAEQSIAHDMGDGAHVEVVVTDSLEFQLDITYQEFLVIPGVDKDDDGRVSATEQESIDLKTLDDYILQNLEIRMDDEFCVIDIVGHERIQHPAGDYLRFRLAHQCKGVGSSLEVEYRLFFQQNPYHQGTLTLSQGGRASLYYFWQDQQVNRVSLEGDTLTSVLLSGMRWGIHHIVVGYDHLLFLLCLLLPSVLVRHGKGELGRIPQPAPSIRPVILTVVQIVTAFTVAHSLTLGLVIMGWVGSPSPRFVEAGIAVTIMLVAVNNIIPIPSRLKTSAGGVLVVMALGLLHGFGFAAGLNVKAIPSDDLVWTLLAVNVGIELGQLVFVLCVVPMLFGVRKWSWYQQGVLRGGSVVAFFVAFWWLVDRLG
ncbi:hypothetical protein A9Q99_09690 [Gammaproteobacteria bacterium 45_16_T64]|nr:hypothetical protein A9Q99_09690 [Gammaproteobacteria bacterium 45_16_T64]